MSKPKTRKKPTVPYYPISARLADALENLTNRFPIEGWATQPNACKCAQFEDTEDCRHLVALRTLKEYRDTNG